MNLALIESFCINSCFISLFITTIYYWFKTLFAEETRYSQLGLLGYSSTFLFLTIHLIIRWFDSGHFPLSNLYESLLFLTWCSVVLHIYIENSLKTLFLGVFTSPALLCLIAFTDLSLPKELQQSEPLIPALQSNWLVMHVTVMIASYAALLLGCLLSIAYLIFSQFFKIEKRNNFEQPVILSQTLTDTFSEANPVKYNLPINKIEQKELDILSSTYLKNDIFEDGKTYQFDSLLRILDNLSYRTIGIGFCFLTLGILSGAVWANETWGNYWSWDPKETWAFITWLTFATYLHSRLLVGWTGSKPAWIASFGFVIVWICYLGVNLIGQGLHSYGFFKL